MANHNPKCLELTWIGKESRPRLESQIFLKDPTKSYHVKHRTYKNDIFNDNFLVLKALEQEFADLKGTGFYTYNVIRY